MSDTDEPWVTACVPAFRSAGFIGATLAALDAQSYPRLRIVVSIDDADDATIEACRAAQLSRPIEILPQRRRLGWVGNSNAALEAVESDYFFICPHDDLVLPDFTSTLLGLLQSRGDAVCAYCDVQTFGKVEEVRSVRDLHGARFDRLLSLLSQRREAVPWRGVTRASLLKDGLRMRDNAFNGYHSHVVWVVELLCKGPLLHHPEPLYRRHERTDEQSVVQNWQRQSAEERGHAVFENTRQCFELLAAADLAPEEWPAIRQALIQRMRRRWPGLAKFAGLTPDEAQARLDRAEAALIAGEGYTT